MDCPPQVNSEILFARLLGHLKQMDGALVTFSGGMDSTFLLAAALQATIRVESATVQSPFQKGLDRRWVEQTLSALPDHPHHVLELSPLAEPGVRRNGEDRCYHCKGLLFGAVSAVARTRGLDHVLDGSNASDDPTTRPGSQAAKELGVRSPLRELGIGKKEIRCMLRWLGRGEWIRPSNSCLATRIQTGTPILEDDLIRVEKAEEGLRELGFNVLRVRVRRPLALLELGKEELAQMGDAPFARKVEECVVAAGFAGIEGISPR